MTDQKKEKLMTKIENHLRLITRQLLKFDTVEEVLNYLIEAFQSRLNCDFIGVILRQNDQLIPKVWNGALQSLKQSFPIPVTICSPILFQKSLTYKDEVVNENESCEFMNLLKSVPLETWFTVPIQDERENYGFCVIGYLNYTPLYEMDKVFNEFGKDVAVAMQLAEQKELERKKIKGIEFVVKNLKVDESLDELIGKIVEQAGISTNAAFAGIYLYNEEKNYFIFHPPSYGELVKQEKIITYKNYVLKDFFEYLEKPGGKEMTVPLTLDLKTLGVLHVEKKNMVGVFTKADLDILTVLAEHVATILKNVYLYQQEKEQMKRLQSLLEYEQLLVKQTIEEEDFDSITKISGQIFQKQVLLFDRYFHIITASKKSLLSKIELIDKKGNASNLTFNHNGGTKYTLCVDGKAKEFLIWRIIGGRNLLGYLAIEYDQEELDPFYLLAVDLVRNIYSVQFIKKKLVIDAVAQVKDNFIEKLLVEKNMDMNSIIQYMNIFKWNLYKPHRVAVLYIRTTETRTDKTNIFEQQSKKFQIFNDLKEKITQLDSQIIFAKKSEEFVLIVPVEKEQQAAKKYWYRLLNQMEQWLNVRGDNCVLKLGIGGTTESIYDYYNCYQQALQTLNVIMHQDNSESVKFFDELGSYTLLHLIKDTEEAKFFMNTYLEKLKSYSESNQVDLFHTLRVFLEQNGSIKHTADKLYIHRSTLLYRLEKIKEIIGMDIHNAEIRFNLLLTYKLYDLQHYKQKGQ